MTDDVQTPENVGGERPPHLRPWPSFAEWTAEAPQCASQGRRCGAAVPVDVMSVRLTEAFPDPPTPDLSLQLLVAATDTASFSADFGRGRFGVSGPGAVLVAPHDTANDFRGGGAFELLMVSFPFASLAAMVGRTGAAVPDDLGCLHAAEVRDGTVERLVRRLWDAGGAAGPASALEADGLATMLVARLLRLGEVAVPKPRRRSRLGARSLARVTALMRARVDAGGAASLAELAEAAGYSEFHFARLFKDATGETCHGCVMRLRLERADRLIRRSRGDGDLTLARIALDCGFSDQSHMTRLYRDAFGVTPAVARDAD